MQKKFKKENTREYINIKYFSVIAYTYLRNYRLFNKEMDNNLINIKEGNKSIFNKITVIYQRKGNVYTKDIFIIMTELIITNISNINKIQYFMELTYYATPPNHKNYKILIILAFNQALFKTILCNLS